MNGNVTTDKTKRKDLSKLEKEMTKIEQPEYPNMDSSSMGRLSQTQYLASVIKVCVILDLNKHSSQSYSRFDNQVP